MNKQTDTKDNSIRSTNTATQDVINAAILNNTHN